MDVTTLSSTFLLESFLTVPRGDALKKSLRRALWAGAAVVVVSAGVPLVQADAAAACAPAWSSTQVYVNGNQASQSGHNYTAKWWTQNESPATHSGQWDVWADQGTCGGTTTPPTTTPPPTTPPPAPPTPPTTTPPATTPPTGPTTPPSTGTKMASSPYIFPGWGNPPAPSTVMNATGIRAFTMAFVLANGCNPVWDGEGGLTGGVHAGTIAAIKAAGGDVVPSIGGWGGPQ